MNEQTDTGLIPAGPITILQKAAANQADLLRMVNTYEKLCEQQQQFIALLEEKNAELNKRVKSLEYDKIWSEA
jgi:hypothetical protein